MDALGFQDNLWHSWGYYSNLWVEEEVLVDYNGLYIEPCFGGGDGWGLVDAILSDSHTAFLQPSLQRFHGCHHRCPDGLTGQERPRERQR